MSLVQTLFSPYTQLFTKVLGNDNIFKGQSSFIVEMSELRSIFKRANNKSLVLGDELCSGTETTSALSIVGAGIKCLSDMKCSYIFTSHLHDITNIPIIKQITNLNIYHLKIEYDEETNILIYNRKLEKGSGPPIYGLEVCKSLDMGESFHITGRSYTVRFKKISSRVINPKKSRYNSNVFLDVCSSCKAPARAYTSHKRTTHCRRKWNDRTFSQKFKI